MKNTFFSNILVVIFLFAGFCADSQVRVKTNTSNSNNKATVKKNQSNYYNRSGKRVKNKNNYYNKGGGIRVKNNRNRIVINKPNRPLRVVKRPDFNRPGYIWIDGYWKWNAFFGRYTWHKARWIKVKPNHYWVPGYWEIGAGGFFWVEGFWEVQY